MVAHGGGLFLFGGEGAFPPKSSAAATSSSTTTASSSGSTQRVIYGDFCRFDIASASWQRFSGNTPSPRRGHSMTKVTIRSVKEPFLVVFGGCGPDKLYQQDTFHADLWAMSLGEGGVGVGGVGVGGGGGGGDGIRGDGGGHAGTDNQQKQQGQHHHHQQQGMTRKNSFTAKAAQAAAAAVAQPVAVRWDHVRVHGGAEDEDRNVAAKDMTIVELEVQSMIRESVPCPRAGHTMTCVLACVRACVSECVRVCVSACVRACVWMGR
jgi:hypothetical protein